MSAARFNRVLADALTLFRVFAAGLVWIGLRTPYSAGETIAFSAFLLGSLSDFFDGRLARAAGGYTSYGKILDPLADKALTLAALAGLASRSLLGWWLVAIVAARDLVVTAARFRKTPAQAAARASGKWKTAFQMLFLTIGLAVLAFGEEPYDYPMLDAFLGWGSIAIAALTLWSGARFLTARPQAA